MNYDRSIFLVLLAGLLVLCSTRSVKTQESNDGAVSLPVIAPGQDEHDAVSPPIRQAAIEREIEAAAKLILLYHRPKDAVVLLLHTEKQLEQLQNHGQQFRSLAEKAKILRRMARGMLGELETVWQESQQEGTPLYLYVVNSTVSPQNMQRADTANPKPDLKGRLVRVTGISVSTRGRNNVIQGEIKYDHVLRLDIVKQETSDALKLGFKRVVDLSNTDGQLDSRVFTLGNANPVSVHLEEMFGQRP